MGKIEKERSGEKSEGTSKQGSNSNDETSKARSGDKDSGEKGMFAIV